MNPQLRAHVRSLIRARERGAARREAEWSIPLDVINLCRVPVIRDQPVVSGGNMIAAQAKNPDP